MSRWTPGFLEHAGRDVEVQVSFSNEERSRRTRKATLQLGQYVRRLSELDPKLENEDNSIPYLKQFDILEALPELGDDLDRSFLPQGVTECFLWIGHAGSVTGLHRDPNDGLLVQIQGRKRVYLFAPDQRDSLYPNQKYDPGTECCDADAEAPDYHRLPRTRHARGIQVELDSGQALFIPRGWFHQVRGLSYSVCVNYFWFSYLNLCTSDLFGFRIPRWLHDRGLYRTGSCVCHAAHTDEAGPLHSVSGFPELSTKNSDRWTSHET